ncbi:hypothetical protein MNAN1_001485 [Malassezia nana]|uniref:ENTH domain-containing protein n=1 Tax=Malassezia nana TaxID=180528 RepID=A0AAF0EHD8_9BASI|nr:hypothetical protein MNAN1_001485 [Malassezia nana]
MSLHVSFGGYEKSVKGATKPKPTLPKEKYMQPILKAAEGSSTNLQDVFWALQARLEDPNSIVCAKDELTTQTVFKALFVLHTMIRSSAATAVLSYLAGDPSAIRLARVASVGLNEYTYSKLLVKYAKLLEQRILIFQELGYDVVLAGKRDRFARLRKMSVSKGLLREISIIQNIIKPLMDCTFFQQESPNELVVAAFQMILKDLLSFYSAMNEGIINMLEHYFEMSQADAIKSLDIYRRFCFQTENVVAFLDSAKRHSLQLRNSIPNLKHAPLSLAHALEDYLHETDFSQHETTRKSESAKTEDVPPPQEESKKEPAPEAASSKQALKDFFEALEQPSATPFNLAYSGFTSFQTQPDWFGMQSMSTGAPMTTGALMGMMPQVTGNPFGRPSHGFIQPQGTGMNPFTPHIPMTPFLTGQPPPFRTPHQPPLMPQHTMNTTPFDSIFGQLSLQSTSTPAPPPVAETQAPPMPQSPPSFAGTTQKETTGASAPPTQRADIKAPPTSSAVSSQPNLRPQKTGTMNPFSIPSDFEEPEPVKRGPPKPTLNELAMNAWTSKQSTTPTATGNSDAGAKLRPQETGLLGSVASEFVRPSITGTTVHPPSNNLDKPVDATTASIGSQSLGPQQDKGPMSQGVQGSDLLPRQSLPTLQAQNTSSLGVGQPTGVGLGISGSTSPTTMNQHGTPFHNTGLHSLSPSSRPSMDMRFSQLQAQRTGINAFASPSASNLGSLGDVKAFSPGLGSMVGQSALSPSTSVHNLLSSNERASIGTLSLPRHDSLSLGMSSGLDHQSQIASLTGIKPFQPSSEFGANLLRGTSHPPTQPLQSSSEETPGPDLLQL